MTPTDVRTIRSILTNQFLLALNEQQKVKLLNCLLEILDEMEG